MASKPTFSTIGTAKSTIDVRLSYKIVDLFSEGLYASPNKAIEELVANAFDAGARRVQVLLSSNLHDQAASIAVIDDGEGMDEEGLRQHWLIGISNKRKLAVLPHNRQQIGKFGIGKLATYVLAKRLTHISKTGGKYYSTSMDYTAINSRVDKEVEPKTPIKIPLRELTEAEAKAALKPWTATAAFRKSQMVLFGKGAPVAWTATIMSSLKPKVHEIKPGLLEWVLRTALPLRPDFGIWLNEKKLTPSKQDKGLIKRWTLGKDLSEFPTPAPKGIKPDENKNVSATSEHRYGLKVPGLGRITGYVEAYKDLLTGKSDELGRSHGFFVYVFGRLINVLDGHFGISPDELRHGTFGRIRVVVHVDALDDELRSNRESVSEGPLLATTQDVLRGIFNAARPTIEKHDEDEEPGAKLARKLAATPASLSRMPIVGLAQLVAAGKARSRYLTVPTLRTTDERAAFATSLEARAKDGDEFVTELTIDYNGSADDGIARYDTESGALRINAWHPFVATFHDEFTNTKSGQPLELLAMAEVLAESHMHAIGVKPPEIEEFLTARDSLLRYLASSSGRESAFSVALALKDARNNPVEFEKRLCGAFKSLGFEVTPIGKKSKPDGVATAILSADANGNPRQYKVSLEAKSKKEDKGKVAAGTVDIAAVIRHRTAYECHHAIVVGRDFPTSQGELSALVTDINDDRTKTQATGARKTITLITIDDLADLVVLRPLKQLGLVKIRELFECRSPQESRQWVDKIRKMTVSKPPYTKIVNTIEQLQKKFAKQAGVKYAALLVALANLSPPVDYETEEQLRDICKGMMQMAPGALFASDDRVELDQSATNVLAAINEALKELPTGLS